MILHISPMNEHFAYQILTWQYEPPYDFYNNDFSDSALQELLENPYYAVIDNHDQLIGFFCTGVSAQVPADSMVDVYSEQKLDIGVGMKPDLTGQGNGKAFFSFVLDHLQKSYNDIPFRLTVAKFNQRAIHLYKQFGFNEKTGFTRGSTVFVTMIR